MVPGVANTVTTIVPSTVTVIGPAGVTSALALIAANARTLHTMIPAPMAPSTRRRVPPARTVVASTCSPPRSGPPSEAEVRPVPAQVTRSVADGANGTFWMFSPTGREAATRLVGSASFAGREHRGARMEVDVEREPGATGPADDVIVTEGLTKVFDGRGGAVRAVDDLTPGAAGRGLRAARPERRGQDHDRRHAHDARDPDVGRSVGGRHRRGRAPRGRQAGASASCRRRTRSTARSTSPRTSTSTAVTSA